MPAHVLLMSVSSSSCLLSPKLLPAPCSPLGEGDDDDDDDGDGDGDGDDDDDDDA